MLYRFDGIHARGAVAKSDFHESVHEAALSDKYFVDDWRSDMWDSTRDDVSDELFAPAPDFSPGSTVARFVSFVYETASAEDWANLGLAGVSDEDVARVHEALMAAAHASAPVCGSKDASDLMCGFADAEVTYEDVVFSIENDDTLAAKHRPISAWSHACGDEVLLKDLFFVCPSCHREPQTEDNLRDFAGESNGYPRFYCGMCGSEMACSDIRDFFISMGITPYPFNTTKKAEWQEILAARQEILAARRKETNHD